jgi:hypothetical protein
MITVAEVVGLVALLVPVIVLWHTLTSFTITSHPLVLSSSDQGQVTFPDQAHDSNIMLVMSNPKQLGGERASTSALGSPHFLGQTVEDEPFHIYDTFLECTPWIIYSGNPGAIGSEAYQKLRLPLTLWPGIPYSAGFVSMWKLLANSVKL